jgi:hypothetical protein
MVLLFGVGGQPATTASDLNRNWLCHNELKLQLTEKCHILTPWKVPSTTLPTPLLRNLLSAIGCLLKFHPDFYLVPNVN